MSISNPEELRKLRAAGMVVRHMLETMSRAVQSGISTGELDEIGAAVMRENGAASAPAKVYGFPEPTVSASTTKLCTASPESELSRMAIW